MGVPALFRWLSRKYPKIVTPVVEEDEQKVVDEKGNEVVIPIDMSGPNPNQMEFDNLYLDMNGIVHPCTHPEGKPAPETEEEMMVEVFKYTERVVNMIRPRKLLFMAIDGVAPRAKMNQQRSRRFRSSQEAKEKEDARKEAVAMWEAMGKTLSDDEKNKKTWDSNAITPGTPFMDLLATSLRYWVVQKANSDPGWKKIQVIISDSSVPGEGEHKIMDFIRRQRTNRGHDPNTKHVIYGLDADLIMLALATHEPHFKVLREDVFSQAGSSTACRICGQEGHYAAQCTGVKAEVQKPPLEKKPFIFLDVTILREYLEVELDVPQASFPFNFEMAIDDWVLLIFFVGNDFLPHLPSLEIREGAIDTLLKIWKDELPRMGGYISNHGQLVLHRAQIILEGLAKREDEIFRRRREAEERQDQRSKRRKVEGNGQYHGNGAAGPSSSLQLTADPSTSRIANGFAAKADSIGLGGPKDALAISNAPSAAQALAGSNHDVVANRAAIRMANLSAAEMLKAEMAGLMPVNAKRSSSPPKPVVVVPPPAPVPPPVVEPPISTDVDMEVPGLGNAENTHEPITGEKRKFDEAAEDLEDDEVIAEEDEEGDAMTTKSLALKVNPDGTVEQEDTVRLWEPGYKERYYRQKFGVEPTDQAFKKTITLKYLEGLAWVLCYYYQGTPSWQWFYPYHFAPFAADFEDVDKMIVKFDLGQPFKPFEQLMGVFPAASRQHIPSVFHGLMIDEDSPIIDFYPTTFDIDMNGKRMAWQGVALLPFIDQERLLNAMALHYNKLTVEELRRNKWGNNILFVSEEHSVYPSLEALYGKKKSTEPVPLDVELSKGISGGVLPNPDCIPGSTYPCPLLMQNLPDIKNDRTLSALYFFPKQRTPHRSVLLPGVRRPQRILTSYDLEKTRRGFNGRGGGPGGPHDYGGHSSSFAGQTYFGSSMSSFHEIRQDSRGGQFHQGSFSQQTYQQNPYGSYRGRGTSTYSESYRSYGGHGSGYGGFSNNPPPLPSYSSYSSGQSYPSGHNRGRPPRAAFNNAPPYGRGGHAFAPPHRGGGGFGSAGSGWGGYDSPYPTRPAEYGRGSPRGRGRGGRF